MNGLFLNPVRVAGGWHMVPDVEAAVVERSGEFLSLSKMPDRRETERLRVKSSEFPHGYGKIRE